MKEEENLWLNQFRINGSIVTIFQLMIAALLLELIWLVILSFKVL